MPLVLDGLLRRYRHSRLLLLLQAGLASDEDLKAIDKEIKATVNEAAEFSKESPEPPLGESIPQCFKRIVARDPGREAVVSVHQQERFTYAQMDRLVDRIWARCLLVFCPLGRDDSHDVSVRMFAPALGVAEDPATGSGAGCLAAYLLRHRCLGPKGVETRVGQGHEIGRPSLLHLRAQGENGAIRVEVGGRVFEVARGTWGEG